MREGGFSPAREADSRVHIPRTADEALGREYMKSIFARFAEEAVIRSARRACLGEEDIKKRLVKAFHSFMRRFLWISGSIPPYARCYNFDEFTEYQ